jgi:hypothetical protein
LLNARDGGQGWQGLHQAASAYDLEIKPRGAGLVIGDRSGRLHVKASDVDRGLSIKALTELLGPYEPAGEQARGEQPQARYARPERTGPLYDAFKREREAAIAAREAAAKALRELWEMTAGWRGEHAGNVVVRWEPGAVAGSAGFNFLEEVRLGSLHEVAELRISRSRCATRKGRGSMRRITGARRRSI